jgi:shikimate kinase
MGSGKSTAGRRLARLLRYSFVDMDREIETATGRTISELFTTIGEAAFRRHEAELLRDLARREKVVVSTGGGVVLRSGNRKLLRRSFRTIWLRVAAVEAWRRIGNNGSRPLVEKTAGLPGTVRLSYFRTLARARTPLYAEAGAPVQAAGQSPDELARAIARRLARPEDN